MIEATRASWSSDQQYEVMSDGSIPVQTTRGALRYSAGPFDAARDRPELADPGAERRAAAELHDPQGAELLEVVVLDRDHGLLAAGDVGPFADCVLSTALTPTTAATTAATRATAAGRTADPAAAGDDDGMVEPFEGLRAQRQDSAAHRLLVLAALGAAAQMRLEERVLELGDLPVQAERRPRAGAVAVGGFSSECHLSPC